MPVPANSSGLWPSAGFGHTPAFCALRGAETGIQDRDRGVLRALAARVAELAQRPGEQAKRRSWIEHNALTPGPPLVLADPENGWNELVRTDELACVGELARRWELVLRKEIFWAERIRDDRPVERVFEIGYTATESGYGVEEHYHGGSAGESYTWDAALKGREDVRRLRFPWIQVDYDATHHALELANELLGDFLEVRLRGVWWWSFGMTFDLAKLVGLERIMLLVYDDPDLLHRVMAFLRDASLARIEWLERKGLLTRNDDNAYVGSGGIGYSRELPPTPPGERVRAQQLWGFTESQETLGLSPAMFEEFVFQYQLPIQERFGLSCYGCCEPLDARWSVVKRTPRLRRVSVSAWADQRRMAESLEASYIYSRKPPPSLLAIPHPEADAIRADIRGTLEAARGCVVELIMKDNHTLGGNPENLGTWVRLCREEIEGGA